MEKIKKILSNHVFKFMMVAAVAMTTVACDDDDDDDKKSSAKSDAVENALEKGTWQVSYFLDDDQDETTNYQAFVFTFHEDGKVEAASANDLIEGTWSTRASDDDDNDTEEGAELKLNFEGDFEAFDDISDSWHVTQNSDSEIMLVDDDDNADVTEYLKLAKIM